MSSVFFPFSENDLLKVNKILGLTFLRQEKTSKDSKRRFSIYCFCEGVNGVNQSTTDMDRHYLYFFSERRVYCIFPTFLGSKQRNHVTVFLQIYHKTRVLKSVCRGYENFYKVTRLVLHITGEKCLD